MPDITPTADRTDRTRTVCRILSKHVRRETTRTLGQWDPAWEIVRAPSERFLAAVQAFERTGRESDMDRAKELALRVRDAWREAGRLYQGSQEAEKSSREEVAT